MSVCLISLGSNQGDRQGNLDAAATRLAQHPQISLIARSSWHETSPVGGPPGQSDFLNGAVKLETTLSPLELLAVLQQIECELGRLRAEHWGPRSIDLDLLLYDAKVLNSRELTLPHPRMAWRRFVLEPATEVAATMLHPTIGWTIARLLEHLNRSMPYVAITGPIAAGKTRLAERLAAAISARLISERPDWDHLETFYAHPANHAWTTELEFLDERAGLLSSVGWDKLAQSHQECEKTPRWDCASLSHPTKNWAVSDFWFEQSAAFARAWLPAERLPEYMERYERLRQTVVAPRFVVLLDAPADELLARVCQRGRVCERPLTAEQLERIRREIVEQVSRPDAGPVLRADTLDADAVFTETLAAVQATE